ncbi:MAG TPA: hypothetical protein VJ694_05045 [Patescibacteria group bacterium]|nr:hypothetical protein [Patescibacteria group bacterium]
MKLDKKQKAAIGKILKLGDAMTDIAKKLLVEADRANGRGRGLLYGVRAKHLVRGYQRFLVLRVLHPDKRIRPMAGADALWHAHILDTRRYHADCQAIFGEYLHHDPGVVDGSQDAAMLELYREAFAPDAGSKPDATMKPLMLDPDEVAAMSKPEDCETCA